MKWNLKPKYWRKKYKMPVSIFIEGFLLQASLILALGAQNIFVLESGLRKNRHLTVSLVCSICDTLLILVGVLGAASFFLQFPSIKILVGSLGVAFLVYYGVLKFKEAFWFSAGATPKVVQKRSLSKTILMTLSFSLLNPHVYLDTMILVGGYSTKYPLLLDRLWFGAGCSFVSWVWFFGLSSLASLGNELLNSARAMRTISFVSSVILLGLSLRLGSEILSWTKVGV